MEKSAVYHFNCSTHPSISLAVSDVVTFATRLARKIEISRGTSSWSSDGWVAYVSEDLQHLLEMSLVFQPINFFVAKPDMEVKKNEIFIGWDAEAGEPYAKILLHEMPVSWLIE